jgi:hypothetical protein
MSLFVSSDVEKIAHVFVNAAKPEIPSLEVWSNDSKKTLTTKKHIASNQLKKYHDSCIKNAEYEFLVNNPLGLYAFSRLMYHDPNQTGFDKEFEIDIKGSIVIEKNMVMVDLAEIKTGKDRKKGIEQLILRLALLNTALQLILPQDFNIKLKGNLIVPRSLGQWDNPTETEITAVIRNLGIKLQTDSVSIRRSVV